MYDISTRKVSRLRGELSSAFVEVAESNANSQEQDSDVAGSEILEQSVLDFGGDEPIGAHSEISEQIVFLNREPQKEPSYTSQKALIFDEEATTTAGTINDSRKDKLSNTILVSSGYSKTSDFTGPSL